MRSPRMPTWSAPYTQSSSSSSFLSSYPFPPIVVDPGISVVNDGFLNVHWKTRSFPQCRVSILLSPVLPTTITTSSSVFPTSAPSILTARLYSENHFTLLSEESLCDVPLNLGFDDVIAPRRKRKCYGPGTLNIGCTPHTPQHALEYNC